MRLFDAWRRLVIVSQVPGSQDTRLAFQAGARYALDEMVGQLHDFDATAGTALRLNEEITDFGHVALLKSGYEPQEEIR